MRNLIRLTDYQKEDVYHIFKIAEEIQRGKYSDFLKGKTIILFFSIEAVKDPHQFKLFFFFLYLFQMIFSFFSAAKDATFADSDSTFGLKMMDSS